MNKQKVSTDFAKDFHIYVQLILEFKEGLERRFVTDIEWYPKKIFKYELGKAN